MRFSVIVPLYNKAAYVEKTLRSVLAQTFTDYELIVIDDGSTDGSEKVALDILDGASHCRLVSQKNSGVSTARNNGVAVSSGEYICFLDADDWWAPSFLEEMDCLIDAYPEAGIYGVNYYYVKSGREQVRVDIPTGYFDYCKEYARLMQMPLTSISVAIPRIVFQEIGGFKPTLKLGEDFDVWIRIALKYKTAFLNTPLAYYNQDVNVKQRGIGHLQDPKCHMLWNLDYLADEEQRNNDLKLLLDNLRVYSLMPYFLSREYHELAVGQLQKVDWKNQPKNKTIEYDKPLWYLRTHAFFMKRGSSLKQLLIRKGFL